MPMKYFTPEDLLFLPSDVAEPSAKTIEIIRMIAHTYQISHDNNTSTSHLN